MTRWRLTIEYDGGPFMGWQRQDHGPSVQQTLEEALQRMTGELAAVQPPGAPTPESMRWRWPRMSTSTKTLTAHRLREGLNALVRPQPISVLDCRAGRRRLARALLAASGGATSTASSTAARRLRSTRAGSGTSPCRSTSRRCSEGAAHLVGRHDFTTFRSAQCQSDSPVKTLDRLDVSRVGEEIHIEAAARSFLHHQVRSMVGCLALVGRGQWRPEDMRKALEARDRAALGLNAPPQGLYFVEAIYPEDQPSG